MWLRINGVAQVASQTLPNLNVIDQVADMLVLRPIIVTDKQDIIDIARRIGTAEFSAQVPEYCGVISVKPTTWAKPQRVFEGEAKIDSALIAAAVADREFMDTSRQYLLCCDRGMMSRLHASHLKDAGHTNVGVYRPAT